MSRKHFFILLACFVVVAFPCLLIWGTGFYVGLMVGVVYSVAIVALEDKAK